MKYLIVLLFACASMAWGQNLKFDTTNVEFHFTNMSSKGFYINQNDSVKTNGFTSLDSTTVLLLNFVNAVYPVKIELAEKERDFYRNKLNELVKVVEMHLEKNNKILIE